MDDHFNRPAVSGTKKHHDKAIWKACTGHYPGVQWNRQNITNGDRVFPDGQQEGRGWTMEYLIPGTSDKWKFHIAADNGAAPGDGSKWTDELKGHCIEAFKCQINQCTDNDWGGGVTMYKTHMFLLDAFVQ
jgi:hypothetical protein